MSFSVSVIIPALNEESSITQVISDLPLGDYALSVIVCDNGSTDKTSKLAREAGARVVFEPKRGYGAACLRALKEVSKTTDIVVFIDGDYSDHPQEMTKILEPIFRDKADFVIGSRILGCSEKGALLPQARFGNWLATFLIRFFWSGKQTDLGPFRAIQKKKLDELKMENQNFGWTVEMQIRALKKKLRIVEVPVSYRKRIGQSKISGTIKGSFLAGSIILKIIFREVLKGSSSLRD